jgi:hypothetical protein
MWESNILYPENTMQGLFKGKHNEDKEYGRDINKIKSNLVENISIKIIIFLKK